MKYLMLLFVFLSAQQKCNQTNELPFIKATSQSWSGGAAAMRGTYYNIYFAMPKSEEIKFDSLWVDNKRLALAVMRESDLGDTLRLFVNDKTGLRNPIDGNEPDKPTQVGFPVESTAEALVGYFLNGKRIYFPVITFTRLKPLAYP
ncbi:MAG: hypothetical protein LH473_01990 [Chitinophagales bacterium]|nr:hypothetical protein [Chitinophagales bacterium]